ncbi:MAG: bifunctional diaminohydroxyphosphoribosylaminopyrimidine deaminase/5-amino-6-(5-phosphoribosylamino)uracil reductase RibD [Lachnospiraceae bacterium]|nr:bifunctional diaminohydroxyphosphoribosylaminopyrimidine deaminase/5-amino-6-(5-phosphoribosylamino)uracil reductase RibD [Lachnospiraceae bacterium]
MNQKDLQYMRRALELAQKGAGYVNPNPMVGAVIVKAGKVIGEGYHMRYGELHAERNALGNCSESPEGATLYVTLEPCCHYGKTPPCTEAIIENGIKRVVIGSHDPNPLVAGKGVRILRENEIEVTEHVLQAECDACNQIFFHYIRTQTPYVIMKYAMTMDGKIATVAGLSQWITGEESRQQVQRDRHRCMGIMVGVGTVLADDPQLTCRIPGGKNPIRIICDTRLRTPETAMVVRTAREVPTIIATCDKDVRKQEGYVNQGCEVLVTPEAEGHVDVAYLMEALGKRKIDSILLEGGDTLNWSCLENGIVQKVQTYIAPKIFGGQGAKTPVAGAGVHQPSQCYRLMNPQVSYLGADILIESEVQPCLPES